VAAASTHDLLRLLADNGFTVVRQLGDGGSAIVFEATNQAYADPVAVKIWRAPLTPDHLRRLRAECTLHRKLSSSHRIAALLGVHLIPEKPPWLVLELYEGSLADRGPGPFPEDQAFDWADDILEGLEAIHSAEYVHRDIKPANILLRGGRAVLADLGLALRTDDRTHDGAAGSRPWRAPELVRNSDRPSFRSDVYSAGQTIRQLFGRDPAPRVDDVLTRACSTEPSDRYPDAGAFRAALAAVRPPTESAAASPESPEAPPVGAPTPAAPTPAAPTPADGTPGHPRRPRPTGKRTQLMLGLGTALALLAATVVATIVATDDRPESPTPSAAPTECPTAGPEPSHDARPSASPSDLPVVFDADLRTDRRWPTGAVTVGSACFDASGYRLRVTAAKSLAVVPAPFPRTYAAEIVEAQGRLVGGQGGWGVWCRGSATGQRYLFRVSHGKFAAIIVQQGDQSLEWTDNKPLPSSFDIFALNRVRASCLDLPAGGGIELTMQVNGVTVTKLRPRTLFSPGRVGVYAFSFTDVSGDLADAHFDMFRVRGA